MRKIYIVLAIVVLAVAAYIVCVPKTTDGYKHQTIAINDKTFDALVADTVALQEKGLGDRAYLPANEAMVFVFDKPDFYGFWMKDMEFSIDMIWLDALGKVVWTEKNVSPDTYPKSFFPKMSASYVVETNAGVVDSLDVVPGDVVELPTSFR